MDSIFNHPGDTIHLFTSNNTDSIVYTIPDHLNYSKKSHLLLSFIAQDKAGFADTLVKKIYPQESYFLSQIGVVVYPTPSLHTITIESTGTENPNYIVFYNNLGQPVLSKEIFYTSGSKIQINISDLPAGLYTAKVYIGEYPFLTKIIKL